MRYYQLPDLDNRGFVADDGDAAYNLTAAKPELSSFRDLAWTASVAEVSLDAIAKRHVDRAPTVSRNRLESGDTHAVEADEVWAAGVTYRISEEARTEESSKPDIYLDVYDAERPEIFFKATPSRTVGPNDAVGIREDSTWNVPEPELGLVLYRGDLVGYTIGNDMSSRSIEGENPLYLPQAKVYERCCSLGPCISTDLEDPLDLEMTMSIYREGERIYKDRTSTAELVRGVDELVSCFNAHDAVPDLAVLLTGTSLVPENKFTLQDNDRIDINIEKIGLLSNPVTTV